MSGPAGRSIPIGGGGLIAGIIAVFKELSPNTKIIGVEAEGAPAMFDSIKQKKIIELEKIDASLLFWLIG